MWRYVVCLLLVFLGAAAMPAAQAQVVPDKNLLMPEPGKHWQTLHTAHFHIHHEASRQADAQTLAAIAERVHDKLSPWLGWQPQQATEVVLLDTADLSNGYATPLPYNQITIYLTPPVDGEVMDQTPWLEFVFSHEYVHILHLDMAYGGPQAVRSVFGRSLDLFTLLDFPQLFAPTWVSEGIAVYGESDNAAGYGRLHSAFYEAMMRMEVQRGLRSLTEVSFNSAYRWPYGQVYLYGAYFFKFVEQRYGRATVTNYIRVYGSNLIPFRMDLRSEQIFGKSAEAVWAEFQAYLVQRFAPQLAVLKQQNHAEARVVYDTLYNNSALAAAGNGDLYFVHDDNTSRPQVMRLGNDGRPEALFDGRGVQDLDWHDTAGLLLSKFAVCDNTNVYADLYRWQPGMTAAQRLTHCGRYSFAAWRPDGLAIAAIQFDHGVSRVQLLDSSGKFLSMLAELPVGDTLGHLDWSPDGASLVASVQRKKSGWNLELLDIKNHQWRALTAGKDLVQRPRFSKDGSEVYFLSDHDKVWNLRRMAVAGTQVYTLSHTAAAIMDAVQMPDNSYRMVEYTPTGKMIIAQDAQARTQDGSAYAAVSDTAPAVTAISNAADLQTDEYKEISDYSPWNTLKPHSWFPVFDTGIDQASYAGVLLNGADALSFQRWRAMPLYFYDQQQLGGLASYSFYNNVTLSAQRQFVLTGAPAARYRDDELRYQVLLHHSFNTLDENVYLAAGVASEDIGSQVIQGTGTAQRYRNKISGGIVQYDNSRLYKNSIAAVEGRRVQLVSESYDLLGGSDYSGNTSRLDWHEYIGLGNNHALHLRLLGAAGDAGIRPYQLGGVSELLSKIGGETDLGRRDFPLRGYPAGLAGLSGNNMALLTAEWKIPLGYYYDGWFVPPLGIGRDSLTMFVDSGGAWNQGANPEAKTGVGAEWNVETLLGYDLLHLATTLGYAHGVDSGGESRVYLRVALPLL